MGTPLHDPAVFEIKDLVRVLTAEILWAMMKHVNPFLRSIARCIAYSVSMSSAEVESSSTSTFASLTRALAIDILCFWPPESPMPLSPITVW